MSTCLPVMMIKNLLEALPSDLLEELSEVLAARPGLRIERIVSRGHASPPGFWYDQEQWEWVLVVSGRARLRFEESDTLVELGTGDHLEIAAHQKHRVEWTDPDQDTVWLAVFHGAGPVSESHSDSPGDEHFPVNARKDSDDGGGV